ncbi:protein-glutamate O-methyltransferase CheR [bacterium]|nr:protein-glutamate O-methyltransferase CheR [bacterium]
MAISQEDFRFVSGYLYRESGINLTEEKAYLVENRLGELCRSIGLSSISALVQELKVRPGSEVKQQMVEAMTTNETSFFRDVTPFESLRMNIFPELLELRKNVRRLRIWSAAASTGQEAYTTAMLLDMNFARLIKDWNVEILGTDLAEKVLERSRTGEYSQLEVNRGLPAQYLVAYFKKKASRWQINEQIRKLVRFQQMNLLEVPSSLPPFDLIFCRNVLIYFDDQTKRKVLNTLHSKLQPDGYLILGASEVLANAADLFERVQRGGSVAYRKVVKA